MKNKLSLISIFALVGCSASGNLPQVFHDPDTNLYGYQGSSGVVIIPPEYEAVRSFDDEGFAEVYDPKRGWITINRFGEEVRE